MTNNNPIIIITPLITATAIVAVVISGFSIGRVGNPNQIGQVENPLSLYPNIETIGVTLNGANLPKTAGLMYRQTGETNWHAGHPLVRIDDGIYREAVTFPSSGTESNWIQVKAEGSAAILDGSETLTGKIWRPHSKARVWFVKIGSPIGYLARDQGQVYGRNRDRDPRPYRRDCAQQRDQFAALTFSWYASQLSSPNFALINKVGTTQFRLLFNKDDNDDLNADYLKFFSGDSSV